jgi:hypothetical protein
LKVIAIAFLSGVGDADNLIADNLRKLQLTRRLITTLLLRTHKTTLKRQRLKRQNLITRLLRLGIPLPFLILLPPSSKSLVKLLVFLLVRSFPLLLIRITNLTFFFSSRSDISPSRNGLDGIKLDPLKLSHFLRRPIYAIENTMSAP